MSAGVLGLFRLDEAVPGSRRDRLDRWRGALASRFSEVSDFHGHDEDGRVLHRFPPVHYRDVEDRPAVFAIGPARDALVHYPWPGERVRLGREERVVLEVEWRPVDLAVRIAPRLVRYSFGAPWLPLNQENYDRFLAMREVARQAELDRVLVGNLLTLCTGLGERVDQRVYAAAIPTRAVRCRLKDVILQGFLGSFVTNLEFGDDLALGKAVSRGFGWFRRDC